jgi:hypothetical protein
MRHLGDPDRRKTSIAIGSDMKKVKRLEISRRAPKNSRRGKSNAFSVL